MSNPYSAKYLVLLPTRPSPCALLFNRDHAFLAEVTDDGFVVDNLVRTGTPCAAPPSLPVPDIVGDEENAAPQIRCYALGSA